MSALVFEGFLSTPEMLAVFDEAAIVQAMLDFEAALARAEAAEGVIPAAAAEAIAGVCRADRFDLPAIVAASGRAGSLAIPLVKSLTEAVARADAQAAGFVHWGSTSQDAIDTAMVLAMRRGLDLVERDLRALTDGLLGLARQHGDAPMLARTLMQPAQVVSLGFKLVEWIAPLARSRDRLSRARDAALQLQLGGAVGTLAVLGDKGPAVARRVADALGLRCPGASWHTQRDELASLACELGVLAGTLGKIGKDIALLSQAEVGELSEPSAEGRGVSSAMPHKRNPVAAMLAIAGASRAAHRVAAILGAMPQEHERGLGNWQAELAETAGLFLCVHGALKPLAEVAGSLHVDRDRMLRNIESLSGLVFAESAAMLLALRIGKPRAHALMEQLSREVVATGRHLRELLIEAVQRDEKLRGHIVPQEVAELFEPTLAARRASELARAQLGH